MRPTKLSPIIEAQELLKLKDQPNLVIIDASNSKAYSQEHLANARFVDLNTQLSNIKENPADGGRHPLPELVDFAKVLSNVGIDKASHIVIYDRHSGANAAARFWWMLTATGHSKVQVLNGGFDSAKAAGFPTNYILPKFEKAKIQKLTSWALNQVKIEEVETLAQIESSKIIDVRSPERYHGENEPIDLVAGHIPSAINLPFAENLDEKGNFLSPEILKTQYENILAGTNSQDAVVYCGSGVTACHSILAMTYAGLETPTLYVGSWSEWSRNKL